LTTAASAFWVMRSDPIANVAGAVNEGSASGIGRDVVPGARAFPHLEQLQPPWSADIFGTAWELQGHLRDVIVDLQTDRGGRQNLGNRHLRRSLEKDCAATSKFNHRHFGHD